jgi:hypothetical protein
MSLKLGLKRLLNLHLAFWMIVLTALTACSDKQACDILDVRDYPSPDGRVVLTAFEYCCYNTTGYDTHLQMRRRRERLRVPGNVCVIEFGREFVVAWASPTNLSIRLSADQLPPPTNITGVTVIFATMARQQ